MSEMPTGWEKVRLQDCAILNPRHQSVPPRTTVSFVPMPAVSDVNGEIESAQDRAFSEVSKGYTHFQTGDVIFAKITPCMENGKIAVARELTSDLACGSTEFHVLRPLCNIPPDFIWRFLRQKSFRSDAEASMTGAVGQRRVPLDYLKTQMLPLPPLNEQRRIIAKIDGLFAKSKRARDHVDHIPRLVEKYKQAILAAAFRGDMTQEWRQTCRESAKWSCVPAGTIIESIVAGKNLRCEERPPFKDEKGVLKVSAVTWGSFDPSATKTLPRSFVPPPQTRVQVGDFLISRANTLELVGAVVIVKQTPPNLYLSDKVLRLEIVEETKPWLLWFLRSPAGRSAIESASTGNQLSMRNLSQSALREVQVPWTSGEERQEVLRRIENAFAWIERLFSETANARRLIDHMDDAILAKAFRGELVPQDPNDEPASVLLERISSERQAAPTPRRRGKREQTPKKATKSKPVERRRGS